MGMTQAKRTKLTSYINYRMRLDLRDGRQLVGRFMAFDRHLNIVLGDCEEFREFVNKRARQHEISRVLGLTIVRGEVLVSLFIEGPPPSDTVRTKPQTASPGPGLGRALGRGIQSSTVHQVSDGVSGPVKGLGNI